MFDFTATYTDQYQITMSQVYFHKGLQDETAVFDYFFRKLPFDGGYAVFAGLGDFLKAVEQLRFDEEIDSFRDFADVRPNDCVLLVDTYDTLKSGVPNAIKVKSD